MAKLLWEVLPVAQTPEMYSCMGFRQFTLAKCAEDAVVRQGSYGLQDPSRNGGSDEGLNPKKS